MTIDEIKAYVKREGGVVEAIHYYRLNPVWLPEDAPAEVKCAWIRLFNQGISDVAIIENWLDKDVPAKT